MARSQRIRLDPKGYNGSSLGDQLSRNHPAADVCTVALYDLCSGMRTALNLALFEIMLQQDNSADTQPRLLKYSRYSLLVRLVSLLETKLLNLAFHTLLLSKRNGLLAVLGGTTGPAANG
jgi:hypothetical protein